MVEGERWPLGPQAPAASSLQALQYRAHEVSITGMQYSACGMGVGQEYWAEVATVSSASTEEAKLSDEISGL